MAAGFLGDRFGHFHWRVLINIRREREKRRERARASKQEEGKEKWSLGRDSRGHLVWIQLLRYEFYVSLSCFLSWIEESNAWLRFLWVLV